MLLAPLEFFTATAFFRDELTKPVPQVDKGDREEIRPLLKPGSEKLPNFRDLRSTFKPSAWLLALSGPECVVVRSFNNRDFKRGIVTKKMK
jgi:hypothetical protein